MEVQSGNNIIEISRKTVYSRTEAASELGISLRTLDRLIAEQKIPVIRIGKRVLISRRAIERFIDSKAGGRQ